MDQRTSNEVEALRELSAFPLVEALYGRRSRRFAFGDEIPDGPLAYRSQHEPVPLTELERMLVLSAMGGTSGWHYAITRNARTRRTCQTTPGRLPRRTFPSAAGFHTAELFFTDDSGLYFFPTRDAGALVDPATEEVTPGLMVERHSERLRKLSDGRLYLPAEALSGGAQHLVRQRSVAAGHSRGRHRPAPDRDPLLLGPERLRDLRRRQRPQDPRARDSSALVDVEQLSRSRSSSSTRSPRPPPSSPPPATPGAHAAGHGSRWLDVRRHRPLLNARRIGQPRRAWPRFPLR